jgi:ABC-type molybdate transport system substrate-binding protein
VYPLVSEYSFTYKEERLSKQAKEFIDFVFSEQGRSILKANNTLPVDRQ